MRSTLSAVFFLATVPLGLMATELQPAGHRTPNVQDTNAQDIHAVGEAQHVSAPLIACAVTGWLRRWFIF